MKTYFDTTVLVAACIANHPHHGPAVMALRDVVEKKRQGYASAHGLAEFFAVLTKAPFTPPIFPSEAWKLLSENILKNFEVVDLNAKEYREAIRSCAENGWAGGRVYDVLHIHSAQKASCDRILTFNVRHFQQLAPEWRERVASP